MMLFDNNPIVDRSALGRRPTEQIAAAKFLASRGDCTTPQESLCIALGWTRDKAKRVLTSMWQKDRVQGIRIDAIELTKEGREWLKGQEVGNG